MTIRFDKRTKRYRDERGKFVSIRAIPKRSLQKSRERIEKVRPDTETLFTSHVARDGSKSYEMRVNVLPGTDVHDLLSDLQQEVKVKHIKDAWIQVGFVFDEDERDVKLRYERMDNGAYAPTHYRKSSELQDRFLVAHSIYDRLIDAGRNEPRQVVVRVKIAGNRPVRRWKKKGRR